jgi:small subunit ribosomal protein S2
MSEITADNTKPSVFAAPDPEIEEMFKAGAHLGHAKSKRNPAMSPYVFGVRNNVEIIDLEKTKAKLYEACEFLKKAVSNGKTVLLAGTRPASRKAIEDASAETGMPAVTLRWVGGTLTNFKVILGQIELLERLEKEKADGEFAKYTKKEKIRLEKKLSRLHHVFDGMRSLKKLPDILFVVDISHDDLPVREARRMRIPIVALTDTNTDPTIITYPVPSNDDALPAVRYMVGRMKDAILEGKRMVQPDPKSQI